MAARPLRMHTEYSASKVTGSGRYNRLRRNVCNCPHRGRQKVGWASESQAAANPAVVSVSVLCCTMSQPWLTAYEQAALKSGIFQSPTSEVSASSSRVSVPPVRQHLSYTTMPKSRRPIFSGDCLLGRFRAIRGRSVFRCSICSPMRRWISVAVATDQ